MQKKFNNLSDDEKKELKELIAKKKANKLTNDESKRLEELNDKCGFKRGKSSSKEGFKPGNDFSWWNKREDLLKDATNYKCDYVAGDIVAASFPFVIPGVLAVTVMDTFGVSSKQTDPINIWARDLYLKMFQKYRVANGYSQSDLGITICATVMLFALVAFYERIYGIINRYSVLNTNMPFAETRALGIDDTTANWLRSHLSDFRYDLNELIARAQRICVPKDISLIADKISLYGYEYLDHASARSQIILFRPRYYATYNETALTSGGAIQFTAIDYTVSSTIINYSNPSNNMCVLLEDAVNALLGSSSVVKMYADLVTWFGESALLQLLPVPEDYRVYPLYSESILHKLHNIEAPLRADVDSGVNQTIVCKAFTNMNTADVTKVQLGYWLYQVDDNIVSAPIKVAITNPRSVTIGSEIYSVSNDTSSTIVLSEHLLDTYHEDVTSETVTEGCLFKPSLKTVEDSGDTCFEFTSCAFEVVTAFDFFKTDVVVSYQNFPGNMFTTSDALLTPFAARMALIDWAPLSYESPNTTNISEINGDIDNIVMIPNTGLRKIHRAVMYSGLHTDAQVIK